MLKSQMNNVQVFLKIWKKNTDLVWSNGGELPTEYNPFTYGNHDYRYLTIDDNNFICLVSGSGINYLKEVSLQEFINMAKYFLLDYFEDFPSAEEIRNTDDVFRDKYVITKTLKEINEILTDCRVYKFGNKLRTFCYYNFSPSVSHENVQIILQFLENKGYSLKLTLIGYEISWK